MDRPHLRKNSHSEDADGKPLQIRGMCHVHPDLDISSSERMYDDTCKTMTMETQSAVTINLQHVK
eukprot:3525829-Amphidinium_carterae.1